MLPRVVDAIALLDGRHGLERLLAFTRQTDGVAALGALAEGIQANRLWHEMGDVRLAGRCHPDPLLAVFGSFSPAQRMLLQDLAAQLDEILTTHRYVDYHEAERAAERLADALTRRFGDDDLSRFHYTAIPRGGWIVLGMLSYLLDLRPDQLLAPNEAGPLRCPGDGRLVVVDDCALSGLRFQQFLRECDASRVIFCPLYANPELCRAIERDEPGVEACIRAEDLQDVAPQRFGEAYPRWLHERRARIGDSGYWCGIAEYIAFAWCEPQTKYWNAEAERFEAGWNVLPPDLCLKRRITASRLNSTGTESGERGWGTLPHEGAGWRHAADRVLWAEVDSAIALACMPVGSSRSMPCFRLEGTAADMWRTLLELGTPEAAESALMDRYAVDPATLRADLARFMSDLEDRGILTRR
ncbi:PqqD family protein [Halomonas kalidii]|uniref:PqqD family protein n=1 Tax=Halomonas kalidii TaxID=3043293 RepID=A0ABT6VN67_9GAMM|nr:PqqD family protein [Halomonas kalidii]MDI5934206.1 PqqD family protein [Halomonas kalidii]